VEATGTLEIDEYDSDYNKIYEAIEDISSLLGGLKQTESQTSGLSAGESMTGGVGTTFYIAPEQQHALTKRKSESAYGVQADIFSLGVILFEMFHPPFETVSFLFHSSICFAKLLESHLISCCRDKVHGAS
jgi:serine/threonine protein kinase